MRTELKVLLVTGIAAIGYWFFRKYEASKLLIFGPGPVSSMSYIGVTPVLSVSLTVQNTSSTDLTINSIAGPLVANGTNIGSVYSFTPTIIPANSQTLVPVNFQLQITGLVNTIIQAFQNKNFTQTISLTGGSANVEGLQIPLNLSFQVGG